MLRQQRAGPSTRNRVYCSVPALLAAGILFAAAAAPIWGQSEPAAQGRPKFEGRTAQEYNQRLEQLRQMLDPQMPAASADEYRIGPDDLLEITVFEAPELNRSQRVSAGGQISLPLLGAVQAGSLTPRELEFVLEELLRRTYMKEPHVGVFVREMQSHAVSVFGAVKKPGVFQVRGAKTVVELLSMAEGLAVATELGLVGAGLLFGMILTVAARTLGAFFAHPDSADRALALGVFAGIVALLLHSLTDFNLYLPANGLVFAVLLGLGASIAAELPPGAASRHAAR